MEKLWDNLDKVLFITFVFGGWVIGWVVSSLATNWRKARESEHQAALKQSMVERGLSAEDIERVINAGKKDDNLTALKDKMVARGMSAADIERVLRAGLPAQTEEEHV